MTETAAFDKQPEEITMAVADRKYLSEYAVSLFSARWLFLTAGALARGGEIDAATAEAAESCHIYFICKRPATSFDAQSVNFSRGNLSGDILYRKKGDILRIPFSIPFDLPQDADRVVVSPYPHREVHAVSSDGKVVTYFPAYVLSVAGPILDSDLRNLEVLYIGQAYGSGNRSAMDRLRSHSTLQKILAESQNDDPDSEIVLLMFEYAPYSAIISFDGISKNTISDDSDSERYINMMQNPLTEHQQICLAEAGLIRYFQPKYNEIYKNSFPASDQKILNECYRYDFCAVVVEVDTEDYRMALFTDGISPNYHHLAKFDLVDVSTRRSFFTFSSPEGGSATMSDVIPLSR